MERFKGVSLFNDVQDVTLRTRNRVMVMANLFEDHMSETKRITAKGSALLFGYFKEIPDTDRKSTYEGLQSELTRRGFITQH